MGISRDGPFGEVNHDLLAHAFLDQPLGRINAGAQAHAVAAAQIDTDNLARFDLVDDQVVDVC